MFRLDQVAAHFSLTNLNRYLLWINDRQTFHFEHFLKEPDCVLFLHYCDEHLELFLFGKKLNRYFVLLT